MAVEQLSYKYLTQIQMKKLVAADITIFYFTFVFICINVTIFYVYTKTSNRVSINI